MSLMDGIPLSLSSVWRVKVILYLYFYIIHVSVINIEHGSVPVPVITPFPVYVPDGWNPIVLLAVWRVTPNLWVFTSPAKQTYTSLKIFLGKMLQRPFFSVQIIFI